MTSNMSLQFGVDFWTLVDPTLVSHGWVLICGTRLFRPFLHDTSPLRARNCTEWAGAIPSKRRNLELVPSGPGNFLARTAFEGLITSRPGDEQGDFS